MSIRNQAVNDLKDLIDQQHNLQARRFSLSYQEGWVEFDTDCKWTDSRRRELKNQIRDRLNLDVRINSRLRSYEGWPTRRVNVRIRPLPNVRPRPLQRTPAPKKRTAYYNFWDSETSP